MGISAYSAGERRMKKWADRGDGSWREGGEPGRTWGPPSWWPATSPTDAASTCSCQGSRAQRYSHAGPAAGSHHVISRVPGRRVVLPGHLEEKGPTMLVLTKGQANASLGEALDDHRGGGEGRRTQVSIRSREKPRSRALLPPPRRGACWGPCTGAWHPRRSVQKR